MNEEEKQAIEYLKSRLEILHNNTQWATENSIKVILNLIQKQQKEIEELNAEILELTNQRTEGFLENDRLKKEIEELKETEWKVIEIITDTNDNLEEMFIKLIKIFIIPTEKVKTNSISKDKIKEILGIEEDIEEEKILSLLQTIVDECNRLEDMEDKKVQVAVDNIEKKRDKHWQDKIREKIKEIEDNYSEHSELRIGKCIEFLNEILEE